MKLSEAFDDACSRFSGNNFDSLPVRDQILVAVYALEAEVNNGGFDQYFFNSAGDQAWFAPAALKSIGAHRMASIVEQANALFGEGGPPRITDERQSALFAITDANENVWEELDRAFYEYPDDIAALLVTHLGLTASA